MQQKLVDKLIEAGIAFFKETFDTSFREYKFLLFGRYDYPTHILDIVARYKTEESIKLFE